MEEMNNSRRRLNLPKTPRRKSNKENESFLENTKSFTNISTKYTDEQLKLPNHNVFIHLNEDINRKKKVSTISLPASFSESIDKTTQRKISTSSLVMPTPSGRQNNISTMSPKDTHQTGERKSKYSTKERKISTSSLITATPKDTSLRGEGKNKDRTKEKENTSTTSSQGDKTNKDKKETRNKKISTASSKLSGLGSQNTVAADVEMGKERRQLIKRDSKGVDRRVSLVPVYMDEKFSKKGDIDVESLCTQSGDEKWIVVRNFECVDEDDVNDDEDEDDDDDYYDNIESKHSRSGVYCCHYNQK